VRNARHRAIFWTAAVLALVFLAGCRGEEPVDADPSEVAEGGEVALPLWNESQGWANPLWAQKPADIRLSSVLFPALFAPGPQAEPVSRLAESYRVSEDGLEIEFSLRQDVLWHDGEPFTARDVAFTWEEILHPEYEGPAGVSEEIIQVIEGAAEYRQGQRGEIAGLEVPDEFTVIFRLTEPLAPALTRLAFQPVVPAHVREVLRGEGDFNQGLDRWKESAVGTGPFKVDEVSDDGARLVKYEDYFLGPPHLDAVVFRRVNPEVAPGLFETGDLDVMPFQLRDWDEISRLEGAVIESYPQLHYTYLGLNANRPPLSDRDVRRALDWLVDTESIAETVLRGQATPVAGHMIPAYWVWEEPPAPTYDRTGAFDLLEEAGWHLSHEDVLTDEDGYPMSVRLVYPKGDGFREQVALAVSDTLSEAGIRVEADGLEYDQVLVEVFEKGEFDLYLLGWDLALDPDPLEIWEPESRWNAVGFESEQAQALVEQARRTYDMEERAHIYREWDREVAQVEVPYIFLYMPHGLLAVREEIQGLEAGTGGYVHNIHRWWLSGD